MNLNHMLLLRGIIERFYPHAAAFSASAILWRWQPDWLDGEFCFTLSNAYLTFFSICFSFVFASLSTLMSMEEKPVVKALKQMREFGLLKRYHWSCVRWCLAGTACGGIGLFKPCWYAHWCGCLFIGAGIGALLASFRVFRLFAKIIR